MSVLPPVRPASTADASAGLLAGAFDARDPGGPRPPGPRTARWSGPGVLPAAQAQLPVGRWLRELLYSEECHRDARGTLLSTPLRAVPSAGGCQPVTAHVICGSGCDLPPGTYAFQGDTGDFVARSEQVLPGDARAGLAAGAEVVFSVLPQRPWGRYGHRCPPLLIADTAFAVCWLGVLAEEASVAARWRPDVSGAADVLGLPGYRRWMDRWPGSAPELMTARVVLGAGADGTGRAVDDMDGAAVRGRAPLAGSSLVSPVRAEERVPRLLPGLSERTTLLPWPDPVELTGHGWLPALDTSQLCSRRSADPWHATVGAGDERDADGLSWIKELVDHVDGLFARSSCRPQVTSTDDPFRAGLSARCSGQRWVGQAPVLVHWAVQDRPEVSAAALLDRAEVHWVAAMEAAALTAHVHAGRTGSAEGRLGRSSSRVVAGWTSDGTVPPVLALAVWP
ncbi:hypothetical protein [Austwickia chelonae]|uniref:hypothetical protein n=1 Tax=Austwickia chelonae TaxID=100225 RepID=UPI000E21EDE6|nr:hypothetical protein [Austwickia chelonae]